MLAEETYRQWRGGEDWVPSSREMGIYGPEGAHQRIEMRSPRSELVWVTVPGPQPWGMFRDVVELNGRKLKDHEGRLATLFASPAPTALSQARKILEESSRYNPGARRDVNLPTLALKWLAQGSIEYDDPRNGGHDGQQDPDGSHSRMPARRSGRGGTRRGAPGA